MPSRLKDKVLCVLCVLTFMYYTVYYFTGIFYAVVRQNQQIVKTIPLFCRIYQTDCSPSPLPTSEEEKEKKKDKKKHQHNNNQPVMKAIVIQTLCYLTLKIMSFSFPQTSKQTKSKKAILSYKQLGLWLALRKPEKTKAQGTRRD